MLTGGRRGAWSRGRLSASTRGPLLGAAALVWMWAAPATAFGAAPAPPSAHPTPSASPGCATPPCPDPAPAHLTLTQAVDRATATVGSSVAYTITLGNTGGLPATAVVVRDALSGTAGYLVADGTAGSANTFAGEPVVTITRVVIGQYEWTYPVVNPGAAAVVKFSVTIVGSRGAPATRAHALTLISTASTPGVATAVVSTLAVFPRSAAATGVPPTGSDLNAAAAGFLLLGGLGFILLALYARERDRAASAGARPPGRSR